MVMATEGASCSAVVSGTAKDTLLVAVAAGVLTLVLVLSVSFNGAEVLVVGAVLNARLMSEFCKTGDGDAVVAARSGIEAAADCNVGYGCCCRCFLWEIF